MKKIVIFIFILGVTAGCKLIVSMTDSKDHDYVIAQTPLSTAANAYFWDMFHQGRYDSIDAVINQLNVALADNAADLITIAHLGFAHTWALAERQRLSSPDPSITEHIFLARRYFEEASKMNPHDPRLLGFLADMTLAEGSVLADKRIATNGYFMGLKSIKMWPQFNKFTIGYVFSNLDTSDKNFSKAINWQYETISDCACEKISRGSDYRDAVNKIKNNRDPKIARACWNSWIAPHNWEGFCLNFGDMLTKKGALEEAKKIYQLARLSDNFEKWPYKRILEQRITEVSINAVEFNKPPDEVNLSRQRVIMFNAAFACMGCHQMGDGESAAFQHPGNPAKNYFFPKKKRF